MRAKNIKAECASVEISRCPVIRAAWFRWATVIVAFGAWVGVTWAFPLYFQRDDVRLIDWVNHHGILDGFTAIPGRGSTVDLAYRPLLYCYWFIMYSLWHLNFQAHYIMTGVFFIGSLICLFRLVEKLSNTTAAWLSVLLWPVAFQFLLTTLFWLTDQLGFVSMMMLLTGLYLFVVGLGSSSPKTAAGLLLMSLCTLNWEPYVAVLGTAVAVHILTRARSLKWSRGKTLGYALLSFAVGPVYYIVQPFARQRVQASGAPLIPTMSDAIGRLSYYGGFLTSGSTGLILLAPAVYFILSRLISKRTNSSWCTPFLVISAVVVSVAIGRFNMSAIGILAIAVAGLLLPKATYILLPVAFVPLGGLLVFAEPCRTYLFLPSYALIALAAMQAREMGMAVAQWWNLAVGKRTLGIVVLSVLAAVGVTMVAHKAKDQVGLLRLRSDVTINVKSITPYLKRLPKGATVVTVDCASMGVNFGKDQLRWTDREKLLYEAPVDSTKAQYWFNDIGREDLKSVSYSDYITTANRPRRVYVWLQTIKDHEFFAAQGMHATQVAMVRRGETKSTITCVTP